MLRLRRLSTHLEGLAHSDTGWLLESCYGYAGSPSSDLEGLAPTLLGAPPRSRGGKERDRPVRVSTGFSFSFGFDGFDGGAKKLRHAPQRSLSV